MTEDMGLKLLAAIEALTAELRTERDATKTLQQQRELKAARQARWRDKRSVSVGDRSVSVVPTVQSLKEDQDQELEDQDQKIAAVDATKTPARLVGVTVPTRNAYEDAYEKRYGAKPPRNESINGKLGHFVRRVGAENAPAIAAFYLTHSGARYVASGHSVGLLLQDAEKLHTEWQTGRRVTSTSARQQDQTQANYDGWTELMSEEGRRALVRK